MTTPNLNALMRPRVETYNTIYFQQHISTTCTAVRTSRRSQGHRNLELPRKARFSGDYSEHDDQNGVHAQMQAPCDILFSIPRK